MTATADRLLANLTGADDPGPLGLGSNMQGELVNGWLPDRAVEFSAPTVIGPATVGPENDQLLEIYRDTRVIPADELGMQGPFLLRQGAIARRAEGRRMPLDYDYGPASLDPDLPGMDATQQTLIGSPFGPGQLPEDHAGVSPLEQTPVVRTEWWTTTPQAGWDGY